MQSVLIGGGYATGREIVEYGAKFGAYGWICGIIIFLGFSIIATFSMEACRQWQVYDYKSLLKKLIGPAWIAYEIVYLLLAILVIAVMASAAGEILHETLQLDSWVGIGLIIFAVGFLNYKGDEMIARLETIGTVALFSAYIFFSFTIFSSKGDEIVNTFELGRTDYLPGVPGFGILLWTGILYVGYNLATYPASFFTFHGIQSKRESILAGMIAGVLMTVPWFLTYFAMMAYYPDVNVIGATVPWIKMLQPFSPWLIGVFGVVVGWTLIETATGMIHAFIHRVETEARQRGKSLSKMKKAYIASGALIASLLLARVGIIDLVAKGYTMMAYAMIAVYGVPILLKGSRLLLNKN
jgi:uncharacterized membrane protein YkvI